MESIVETARLAGVTSKLDPNLSLALGSSAVSPLDMAAAYSTFVRGGVSIKPQMLRRIENNRGQVIQVFEGKYDKVFNMQPVAKLVDVLQDVVKYGTGTGAKLEDRPVGGKTGTADEGKDIWFIGFTPDLVTAVWGGNDENKPIAGHNVTGGVIMARIWKEYMKAYYTAIPTPAGTLITPSPEEKEPKPDGKLAKENSDPPLLLPGLKFGTDEPKQAPDAAVAKEAPEKPKVDTPATSAPLAAPIPEPAREAPKVAPEPAPAPQLVPEPAPSPAPAAAPSTSSSGATGTFIAPSTPTSRSKYSPYEPKPAFAPADPSAAISR